MALFYSGEYYPPENLTTKISRELTLLRLRWSDSLACVRYNTFQPPWFGHGLEVLCDSTTEMSILDSSNAEWNALLDSFDLSVKIWNLYSGRSLFLLRPLKTVNPNRLAEAIHNYPFTGITWISASERPHPFYTNIARVEGERSVKYFFCSEACPDLWNRYDYFEVTKSSAKYRGSFRECPEDSAVQRIAGLPWQQFEAAFDSMLNDIEMHRPSWADTARSEIRKIESTRIYQSGSF